MNVLLTDVEYETMKQIPVIHHYGFCWVFQNGKAHSSNCINRKSNNADMPLTSCEKD